ncbi:carbohydrate ABC transporter permease [Cohnella terricola]|uniref:Sugar ABC transporter permease n=1 Tax=Cohnella terricola TaxID=1289167 RepID=A0A559JT19_9BACL|nr:sugar ABC transporter permease [Cohnella terricola]TVY02980.1 sugar ABC transporter permease [Cohnella terricola]
MALAKHRIKRELIKLSFLIPAVLFFVVIIVLPFVKGLSYSFTDWDGISESRNFIGFKNYSLLFQDHNLLKPLKNTLFFWVVTLIGTNGIGLMMALAVNGSGRFNRALRTVFFLPFVLSLVLVAFLWTYLYSEILYPYFGVKSLLGNPHTVMWGISIMAIWKDAGYCMVIYLAALQLVPAEYYEAAKVEGAGLFRRFISVTLPMIVPALTANITLLTGWGLKVFDYPMTATGGGPGNASETLAIYVYNYTFPYNQAGYGQAAAIMLLVLVFAITAVVAGLLRRKEVEM